MGNIRYHNGHMRRKQRARFKAQGAPCGICGGKLGPIHYDEPSDHLHPLSFVIDEILPVSRWREFGYGGPFDAVRDPENTQPAHYICNLKKRDKTMNELKRRQPTIALDGRW